MNSDCRLEIRPNGPGAVQVIVRGPGFPLAGQPFARALPPINDVAIDSFRSGSASIAEVLQLGQQTSDWLLGPDLRLSVNQWLQANPAQRLRFVFTVDDTDETLQQAMGDFPFELVSTGAGSAPLAVHQRVDGFVHLLPKVGTQASIPATATWPLRILVIRANPTDYGGQVPPAAPIRQHLLDLAAAFGDGMVQIDLLSDEPQSVDRPTWNAVLARAKAGYDILLYLGHGDVQQLHQDLPALAQIQLEAQDDPNVHEPVTSTQLANLLRQYPIPVVVLAGCLTAADPGAAQPVELPQRMRGNQGMAQALVNSESGVLFAVGMRCKIDAGEAVTFLIAFFDSLFTQKPGNIEQALRAGRLALFLHHDYPPSWAGPVAFSTEAPEPLLDLKPPSTVTITATLSRELDALERFILPMLASQPPAHRPDPLAGLVQQNRDNIIAEILGQHSGLMLPGLVDAQPDSQVDMTVTAHGVGFTRLTARVTVGPGVSITGIRATQPLLDAGYQVLVDPNQPGFFQIQRTVAADAAPIQGVLVIVNIAVAADALGVCPVRIEVQDVAPNPLWAGPGAVIVTLPA